jgi:hypothetical protein
VDASYFSTRFLKSQTTVDVLTDDFRLSGSPYPGLRSFRPQEGNVFFGRDRSVNEIRDRLADLHVAVVLGGSGSGKSSVVRAGLIPRLNSTKKIRGCPGNWYAAEFRPRLRPMDEMVEALADLVHEQFPNQTPGPEGSLGQPDRKATLARLKTSFGRKSRKGLDSGTDDREIHAGNLCDALFDFVATELDQRDRTATKGLRAGRPNLLLVVDQFEEIFRQEVERTSGGPELLDLLLATYSRLEWEQRSPSEARSGLFIVLTMRSEELHRCTEHPSLRSRFGTEDVHRSLADMVNRSAYLLDLFDPVQDRDALREAIIYPARRMFQDWGLPLNTSNPDAPFGPGVPDWLIRGAARLGRELEHRPDQLPLLQHALQTMWQHAVANWAVGTNQQDFIIQCEHLAGTEPTLLADGPDLSACLDERASDAAREAIITCDNTLRMVSAGEVKKPPYLQDKQPGLGGAATRAAFRALAQRDDRGIWVRRFASPQQIIVFMHADPVTAGLSTKDKETCLRSALSVFVSRGYLVEKGGQYDISHEALIRNWKMYQEWLRQPEEVAQTLTRLATDIDPAEIEKASGDCKRELLLFNFPVSVRDKLATIFRSQLLPVDWAIEQIIPLVKRPTLANRWAPVTLRASTNEESKDKITARAILDRLWYFVEHTEQAQKRMDQERKHQRQVKLAAGAAIFIAILAIIGGSIVQFYANKRAFVERLITFAQLDSGPNFRQRIMILLHALDESKGVGRFFADPKFARDSLRNVLVRAPKLGGTYKAVGFNSGGTKLAILDGSELTVHDLSEQTSASPLMVSWPPRENWPASPSSYRLSGFEPYAAGFIDHPERGEIPAVYHEGIISYWDEHGGHFLDVRQVLPPIFANANLRNIELMHTVRITANTRSGTSFETQSGTSFETHFFELALTKDENGRLSLKSPTMSPHDSVVRSSGARYNPTIATQCGLYGYLQNQGKSLVVHQLGRAEPPLKVDLSTSMVEDDTPGGSFARSISFSADCSAVTIRDALDHLHVIPIEVANGNVRFAEMTDIIVPEGAQDVAQPLSLRARPLIASLQMDDRYRFAWLTRNGIAVIDAPSRIDGDRKGKLVFGAPILTGLENAAKLQFSRDGRFLILIHQSWGASHAKVRVWEINESVDRIPWGDALVEEACRIARQENGRAALEEGESLQWFGEHRNSPCQEIIETLPDPLLPHRHRRGTP